MRGTKPRCMSVALKIRTQPVEANLERFVNQCQEAAFFRSSSRHRHELPMVAIRAGPKELGNLMVQRARAYACMMLKRQPGACRVTQKPLAFSTIKTTSAISNVSSISQHRDGAVIVDPRPPSWCPLQGNGHPAVGRNHYDYYLRPLR
jgi:hypothetical protein